MIGARGLTKRFYGTTAFPSASEEEALYEWMRSNDKNINSNVDWRKVRGILQKVDMRFNVFFYGSKFLSPVWFVTKDGNKRHEVDGMKDFENLIGYEKRYVEFACGKTQLTAAIVKNPVKDV